MAARYAIQDPPVWLLDVDGVLNASRPGWGGPGRAAQVTVDGCSLRLRWEPKTIACVRTLHLGAIVEVQWCTTWCPFVEVLEGAVAAANAAAGVAS